MSIEAVGRATERIAEIASRFSTSGSESRFHDLLVDAARTEAPGAAPASVLPYATPSILTLGQMLGLSPVASTVLAPGQTVFPVSGVSPDEVTNSFGRSWGPHRHAGVDIFAPTGTPVVAPVGGEIELASQSAVGGNRIWLRGSDGRGYYLAHLDGFADGIVPGAQVAPGQVIGFVGSTGDAAGKPPHLHFAVSRDADLKPGDSMDPAAAGWLDPGVFLGMDPSPDG